jgi:hypothetical protein
MGTINSEKLQSPTYAGDSYCTNQKDGTDFPSWRGSHSARLCPGRSNVDHIHHVLALALYVTGSGSRNTLIGTEDRTTMVNVLNSKWVLRAP